MKKLLNFIFFSILLIGIVSCGTQKDPVFFEKLNNNFFNNVAIETLVADSTLNVRAIELVDSKFNVLTYLTSKGEFGMVLPKEMINHVDSLKERLFYNHKINLSTDSLKLNFRALSASNNIGYGITIGSPARIYKLDADLEKNKLVYQENHEKAFYDSIEFWNNQEGIAIGDPTDNCISVIITRDGGETWNKLSCNVLPKTKEGEAAFAASDTNIAIVGDKTWVATGGKASRILFSPDKGKTWQVFETPIIQGLETTGMYSVDFYDENNGFAIGGDYTKPNANAANKIRTKDGGKTWQLVAPNQNPGYRSCVKYIPKSNAKSLVAIGFKGIDISHDAGNTWKHLSDEGFYTIRFVNDSVAYAAGNKRISKLTFSE